MPEQIDLNKAGGERDYGPFSNDNKDDISPDMKAAIEALRTMEFPQDNDAINTKEETTKQSQDSASNNEPMEH